MSTVTEIIEAVKQLDERAKGEFLDKLAEINFDDGWDRQIDADAKAGRLDPLIGEAIREHREGKSQPPREEPRRRSVLATLSPTLPRLAAHCGQAIRSVAGKSPAPFAAV